MDKAKEFQEWVLKYELSESTVKALQENGFDSTQSCELWNSAMIQKHFAKALTLGQTLLLQKAVINSPRLCGVRSGGIGKGFTHSTGQHNHPASRWCHLQCFNAHLGCSSCKTKVWMPPPCWASSQRTSPVDRRRVTITVRVWPLIHLTALAPVPVANHMTFVISSPQCQPRAGRAAPSKLAMLSWTSWSPSSTAVHGGVPADPSWNGP